jgi:RPA family protein
LNDVGHTFKIGDDDRAPNFALLPSGDIANRVFIVGTLTEVEDVSDDPDDEYLRGRVVGQSGTTFVYAGQYAPDAAAFLRQVQGETPTFVAVTGKVQTYETDEGDTNVSVKPEVITEVDRSTREQWVSQTAAQTLDRIKTFEPEDDYFDRLTIGQYDSTPTDYVEGLVAEADQLIVE